MTKTFLMKCHRWLGIVLAGILGVMALSGTLMSFEDEIAQAISPRLFAPGVPTQADMTPDPLIVAVEEGHPGFRVDRLEWPTDRAKSVAVRLAPLGKGPRVEGYADRSTGQWLGESPAAPFFATTRRLHRWLLLPADGDGWGRTITGLAAIGLVLLALSGLYLRWPYKALRWREWLVVDWRRKKRLFWRSLHVVVATWAIPFWLLSAATGLWWSYPSYRDLATRVLTVKPAAMAKEATGINLAAAAHTRLDPVWQAFWRDHGQGYRSLRLAVPDGNRSRLIIEALPMSAQYERAVDRFTFDAASARQIKADYYAQRPLGLSISQSMLELHRGAMLGGVGRVAIFLSTLILALASVSGAIMFAYREFKLGRKPH